VQGRPRLSPPPGPRASHRSRRSRATRRPAPPAAPHSLPSPLRSHRLPRPGRQDRSLGRREDRRRPRPRPRPRRAPPPRLSPRPRLRRSRNRRSLTSACPRTGLRARLTRSRAGAPATRTTSTRGRPASPASSNRPPGNVLRVGKAASWLKEERRKTLGDWVAVCVDCGFAVRYVDERESELPAACPQCAGELRGLRRPVLVGVLGRVRGLRRPAQAPRALRNADPQTDTGGQRRRSPLRGPAAATGMAARPTDAHR
jgi:hypothetical protein